MSDMEMNDSDQENDFDAFSESEDENDDFSPMSAAGGGGVSEEDYFAESQDEGPDFVFDSIIPEKNIKKSYQVDFKPFTANDLLEIQRTEINHVANILGLKPEIASVFLRHFKWNKEKLIEKYMENEEETCKLAGIMRGANDLTAYKICCIDGFTCDICCSDEPDLLTFALGCQHRFCKDCYKQYLTIKISEDGESKHISCPGSTCHLIVDEKSVEMIVDADIYKKYQTMLHKTYVDDIQNLKWCPFPNCTNAVQCKVTQNQLEQIVPSVECSAHHHFCFGCSLAEHQPATCTVAKLWLKKCADDSETANWIAAHTKECPKCNSTIEKNGGCNHMTCKKCKYEFCWICHGNWADHGTSWYTCNRYEEKDSVNARDAQAKSRAALERYLHYYNRYANHGQSAKLDKELFEKTERKMESMQQTSEFSWIQVQFLKSAVEVLLQSRQTLMWTYCLAFFLTRSSNATALFEDNQRDLEMAVESLSELLEKEITSQNAADLRKSVLDKTEYVNRRRQVLLSDSAIGHKEKRWSYNFDV